MPSLSSAEQPLITVDDLLCVLYLYPKRMDVAVRRMLNVQCARVPSDCIPEIADRLVANSVVRLSGCAVPSMLCNEFIQANLPAFVEAIEHQVVPHAEEWEPRMVD